MLPLSLPPPQTPPFPIVENDQDSAPDPLWCKWTGDTTLANMYNSELVELFLQFEEKDEILVGRAAEAVLLAFAV